MRIRTALSAAAIGLTFTVTASPAQAQVAPGAAASLAARLAALEARVTALETVDVNDIPGTYQFVLLGIELNRGFSPSTPARVNSETAEAFFTLKADGTVEVSGSPATRCTLPVLVVGVATCEPLEEEAPTSVTWSYANGIISIVFVESGENEVISFALTRNGVAVSAGSSEFEPGHSWANLAMIVKVSN